MYGGKSVFICLKPLSHEGCYSAMASKEWDCHILQSLFLASD